MHIRGAIAALSIVLWLSVPSKAQTGMLDQVSPWTTGSSSAWFNGDAPSLTWQAQVNVGIAGPLEGFKLRLDGPQGATLNVRLRSSAGWSTLPVVFQTLVVKQLTGYEDVFVDVTSANQIYPVNAKFVIELQGAGTGCGMLGTYIDPNLGQPLYPEPLFLGGPGCFTDCGWRIGFETYVHTGPPPPTPYCTSGTSVNGCVASITASANPRVNYSSPCNINVSGADGQRSALLFYGLQSFIQPWCQLSPGSSMLCVKAPTYRFAGQNTGGALGQCNGSINASWNGFQLSNPGALGAPWTAGEKAYVQGWFRDPASCKTTTLSNAVEMTYEP